jgi:RNA polymerase sigma-70 factor (ECF subfamily)
VQTDEPGEDVQSVVYAEIDRLPESYRSPVVLCLLEGLTHEEAAQRLCWPVGTVSGRLSRARVLLRWRLARRGVSPAVGALAAALGPEPAAAAIVGPLAQATTRLAAAFLIDRAAVVSTTAAGALSEGVMKTMLRKTIKWTAAVALAATVTTGGIVALAQRRRVDLVDDRPKQADLPASLRHGDGQPDGKKSLGGSGEMIEFHQPARAGLKVAGLKIHGARYGLPEPPDEQFLIYVLSEGQDEVLSTQMAPYSLFERGAERWVEVKFKRPVPLPARCWIALDFRAHQTKGVYVSIDTSTGGQHSRIGLPGLKSKPAGDADWMIELLLSAEDGARAGGN